jgi:hypothetical protein
VGRYGYDGGKGLWIPTIENNIHDIMIMKLKSDFDNYTKDASLSSVNA